MYSVHCTVYSVHCKLCIFHTKGPSYLLAQQSPVLLISTSAKQWSCQGYRKCIYALKIILDKLSSVGQFGLRIMRNLSYCPIFGQLVMQIFRQGCVQHANGWTTVGQCFINLSNNWTVLCPTVQWLVYAMSNCPMACDLIVQQSKDRLCFFQLSNSGTVLCPTFQKLDKAVSNCPMVGQSSVQQSNAEMENQLQFGAGSNLTPRALRPQLQL